MTYAICGVLVFGLVFGSIAISSGIATGMMIITGLSVIFTQLPMWMRRWIISWHIIFDGVVSFGVFIMLSSNTATGIVGGVSAGLLCTLLLHHQAAKGRGRSMVAQDAQTLLRSIKGI